MSWRVDDVLGPEPDAVADLEDPPGLLAAATIRSHSATDQGHRLLAEDVHAGLERLDRRIRVQEGRQGDREGVDRPRRQQLAQVGIDIEPLRSIWSAAPSTFPLEGSPAAASTLGLASQIAVTVAPGAPSSSDSASAP